NEIRYHGLTELTHVKNGRPKRRMNINESGRLPTCIAISLITPPSSPYTPPNPLTPPHSSSSTNSALPIVYEVLQSSFPFTTCADHIRSRIGVDALSVEYLGQQVTLLYGAPRRSAGTCRDRTATACVASSPG